jgi:hypothetical protein
MPGRPLGGPFGFVAPALSSMGSKSVSPLPAHLNAQA